MNWHEPLITPATAVYCVVGWLAIEAMIWIVRKAMKEEAQPDLYEHVDGEGR
jgi:hypothetical protein